VNSVGENVSMEVLRLCMSAVVTQFAWKKPGNISESVANDGVRFLSIHFPMFQVSRYFSPRNVQFPVSCDVMPHIFVDQCWCISSSLCKVDSVRSSEMLFLPTTLHDDTSKIRIFIHTAIVMPHLRTFWSIQHDQSLCMLVKSRGCWYLVRYIVVGVGWDIWGGKVTRYGLGGLRIESQWGQLDFPHHPDWPWGPPSLLYSGYQVYSLG
jgi:hypothetical protein